MLFSTEKYHRDVSEKISMYQTSGRNLDRVAGPLVRARFNDNFSVEEIHPGLNAFQSN